MLSGRVLITGGAGFLARAIYRRAAREGWPVEFTCLSRDDAKHARLQARYPEVDCVLGDVAGMSVESLSWLLRGFDVVIHAAAQKYVDRSEHHAFDTVRVNIDGSLNVALAAVYARVPLVVGISTDKACQPINTYGITKAAMERLFAEASGLSPATEFRLVRYGNVIGSTGSVIPLFYQRQRAGEPIRVTDPTMTRFWMSPDEAVDTIVQCVTSGTAGHITVPDMRAMGMDDLAVAIADQTDQIGWKALMAEGRIVVIGPRPGEKQNEQIISEYEAVRTRRVAARYSEIGPPDAPPVESDVFDAVWSNRPPGGWMAGSVLRDTFLDAESI